MVSTISDTELFELMVLTGYEDVVKFDPSTKEPMIEGFLLNEEAYDPASILEERNNRDEEPIIEFDHYSLSYGDRQLFKDLSFSIFPGECIAIMGLAGSGKTTLLEVMNGLTFGQEGTYFFEGELINRENMADKDFSRRLHQRMGIIYQNSASQLGCSTVEEEISFAPRQLGLSEDKVKRRVDAILRDMNLEHLRGRSPRTLSSGEQKRLAIACIMTLNPDVYCFDEPLAGMDSSAREWLLKFLYAQKQDGKTVIIATHDPSLAERLSDLIVYLDKQPANTNKPYIRLINE